MMIPRSIEPHPYESMRMRIVYTDLFFNLIASKYLHYKRSHSVSVQVPWNVGDEVTAAYLLFIP